METIIASLHCLLQLSASNMFFLRGPHLDCSLLEMFQCVNLLPKMQYLELDVSF